MANLSWSETVKHCVAFSAIAILAILCMGTASPALAYAETADEPAAATPLTLGTQAAPESYTYEVHPILAPFNRTIYVKTNNPDPYSFLLVDPTSTLANADPALSEFSRTYQLLEMRFLDVKYENASTYRVPGGYIFRNNKCGSDGGSLTLKKQVNGSWVNTSVKVACPKLTNTDHYLMDNYAASASGTLEKVRAIQHALDELAVYPRAVYDMNKPNPEHPYPLFSTSPYKEVGLHDQYPMYLTSDQDLLIREIYPFQLASEAFPDTIARLAQQIDPSCSVSRDPYEHWMRTIVIGGKAYSFGGAGKGGAGRIFSKFATVDFRFDGSAGDWGTSLSMEDARNRYMRYLKDSDEALSPFRDQLTGEGLTKAISSGSWILVYSESGGQPGVRLAYMTRHYLSTPFAVCDHWVDGRYVNYHERLEPGARLEDHMDANLTFRDVEFIDKDGNPFIGDLTYWSPNGDGNWEIAWPTEITVKDSAAYPETLTYAQAKRMGVDANTNTVPDAGLIYDGSEPLGTPFSTVHVTGISVAQATITTSERHGVWLDAKTTPSNATFPDVTWSSSDESVCTVSGHSLTAVKEGTAVLTATAVDGGLTATCTVKVEKRRPSYWEDGYDEYISGSDDAKAKKKANPMVVKAKKKVLVVSRAKLKAKKVVIAKKKAFRISKAKGEVTFKVAKYDKKAKKRIYVTKAGKLVVKRGLARGIYTLKVKVRATGNAQYATKAKIVKLKVRVK